VPLERPQRLTAHSKTVVALSQRGRVAPEAYAGTLRGLLLKTV